MRHSHSNPRRDAGAYHQMPQGACDPAWVPRAPLDDKGCPIGRVVCQQELGLDAGVTLTPNATATLTFVPYRQFTPHSLWNSSSIPGTGVIQDGLIITSVTIGASEQIKGELSGDLYLRTADRGHDVHWDSFDPNTPLIMQVRNDNAADLRVGMVIKGAAYKR